MAALRVLSLPSFVLTVQTPMGPCGSRAARACHQRIVIRMQTLVLLLDVSADSLELSTKNSGC